MRILRLPFVAALIATSIPLGRYMARVFNGERTWLDPLFRRIERLVLRVTGVTQMPTPVIYDAHDNLVETMPIFAFGFPLGDLHQN